MEAIGDEERAQAAGRNMDNLSSFSPESLPANVTHYPLDLANRKNKKHFKELDAERFLPCHYFDLICGSSTGRYV